MAKMIHSMIRVLDEARSTEFYDKAFGLKVADRIAFETFTLVYLSNAETGFELELTVNQGRIEPYAQGDAYGHLAVSVAELRDEHARMTNLGLNPGKIIELNRDGKLFALLFFVTDPDGYKIEVVQRHGRFQ
ncbi:VOC family protein [Rhizobium sp.]|uniref:VOC family protein n=1 Tax=Rhizobium sp. TaxID=391 RepID=UPI003F7EF253